MVMYTRLLALVMLVAGVPTPVQSQDIEPGEWSAQLTTPGGELVEAKYVIQPAGAGLQAIMKWPAGQLRLWNFKIEGDRLTYSWNPGFHIDCRLDRQADRRFVGSCKDEQGFIGPATLLPPGVNEEPAEVDFDAALALWGLTREEYRKGQYPEAGYRRSVSLDIPEELPGRKVAVEGLSFNLVEHGEGPISVVLESGLGDDHHVWREVQEKLSERTRVVSYDRAGLGLSDATSSPRTPQRVAEELYALLKAAQIPPPYLLVGHEAGALHVRSFASRYEGDVAGLVLVDPAHEKQADVWRRIDARSWEQYLKGKELIYDASSEARRGEFRAFADIMASGRLDGVGELPDVPLTIISAVPATDSPRWVGETPEGQRAKHALFTSFVEDQGGEVITTTSRSYVHLEEPGVVVEAIEKMLDAIGK